MEATTDFRRKDRGIITSQKKVVGKLDGGIKYD